MTERQERFCSEYEKDGDARGAAIRAGYPAKTAAEQGRALLLRNDVLERLGKAGTAPDFGAEALRLLTGIARGETTERVIGKNGETLELAAGFRERLKAIELIELISRRSGAGERGGAARTVWVIRDDL